MKDYSHVRFDWRTYNCGHFVREVWLDLTGVDLGLRMPEKITREDLLQAFSLGEREIVGKIIHEIPEPVDPCLVMFQTKLNVPHVGVYVDGALLHLPKNGNVEHAKLEAVMSKGGYSSARYFR